MTEFLRPRRHDGAAPVRAVDDDGPVPYQVALAAQDVLDAILGDDYFTLGEIAVQLARLGEYTSDGHGRDRQVWTGERVLTRVRELAELYNPPPELGGDDYPTTSSGEYVETFVCSAQIDAQILLRTTGRVTFDDGLWHGWIPVEEWDCDADGPLPIERRRFDEVPA